MPFVSFLFISAFKFWMYAELVMTINNIADKLLVDFLLFRLLCVVYRYSVKSFQLLCCV